MLKGISIDFKNRPNEDGTVSNLTIKDCLISPNGSPRPTRSQVLVHLPKADKSNVEGAWFEYGGFTYHLVGVTAPSMEENTPTRWDRYCIAEKIY